MGKSRWALVWSALICACPNDDAVGTHATPCPSHTAWEKRCQAELPYWGDTECLDSDWQDVRAPFLDAMIDCFETLECDASDDRCEAAGLHAIGITDEEDVQDDALFQRCRERTHACTILDDYCVAAVAFTDDGRGKLAACLELDCSMLDGCLRNPRR